MTPRERVFALEHFGIKLGLDNIRLILDALDRPQASWRAVHVAGTNGKGSVTAMVELGLRTAGHRTGRYTSPHLSHVEERIAIDGESIDAARFDEGAADVLAVVDGLRASGAVTAWPTFFEVTTAMAFEIFRRSRIDVAVVEVGLGGRFDATNVLAPAVTAITSIALDHQRHLGGSLSEIAFEKAGIIKPETPVVVGELVEEARAVVLREAGNRRATVIEAGLDLVEHSVLRNGRATITLRTACHAYEAVTLGLAGAHQIANAVVAARTLEACRDRSIRTSSEDVLAALSRVRWPARLEWLRVEAGRHVLIDAAHNPAGAQALAAYLLSAKVAPLPVVLAVMQDKDIDAIIGALAPIASLFVATEVGSPRCTRADDLAARISRRSLVTVATSPDPAGALAVALARSPRAVIAGSIFLAGPLRTRLVEGGATPVDFPS